LLLTSLKILKRNFFALRYCSIRQPDGTGSVVDDVDDLTTKDRGGPAMFFSAA